MVLLYGNKGFGEVDEAIKIKPKNPSFYRQENWVPEKGNASPKTILRINQESFQQKNKMTQFKLKPKRG